MTKDDIINMAREAGMLFNEEAGNDLSRAKGLAKILDFASLVAAKERDACKLACLAIGQFTAADAIRTRGNP